MIIRFGIREEYGLSNKHIPVTHIQQADPDQGNRNGGGKQRLSGSSLSLVKQYSLIHVHPQSINILSRTNNHTFRT